jgi:hypothetical protein
MIVSISKCKFVAVHILYGAWIQISVSILCDLKGSPPVNMLAVLILDKCIYINITTEDEFMYSSCVDNINWCYLQREFKVS